MFQANNKKRKMFIVYKRKKITTLKIILLLLSTLVVICSSEEITLNDWLFENVTKQRICFDKQWINEIANTFSKVFKMVQPITLILIHC